jgi:predicted Zn-dependent protease
MLASGELEHAREAVQALNAGRKALKAGDPKTALTQADAAEKLNPGFYQNAGLRGRALLQLNRPREAAAALEQALARRPAFRAEEREPRELLNRINQNN